MTENEGVNAIITDVQYGLTVGHNDVSMSL
jgi:hypothetical protein